MHKHLKKKNRWNLNICSKGKIQWKEMEGDTGGKGIAAPVLSRGRCQRTVCSRELSQDRVREHMTGAVQTDLHFVQRSGVAVLQFLIILSLQNQFLFCKWSLC